MALALLAEGTFAQELLPLKSAIAAGAEDSYPVIRCAALFFSVLNYAGTDRFEPDFVESTKETISTLIATAVMVRIETQGTTQEVASDAVHSEVLAIADLYDARFRLNYSTVGQAFGADDMVQADLGTCKMLIDVLNEQ